MLVLVDYYSYNNYIIIVVTSLIMIIMAITVSLALALVTLLQKLPVGAHAPSIFQACCLVKKFRPCFAASGGA